MEVHFPTLNKWRSSCFQRQDKSPEKAAGTVEENKGICQRIETGSREKDHLSPILLSKTRGAGRLQPPMPTTLVPGEEEEKSRDISLAKKTILGVMAALGLFGCIAGASASESKEDLQRLLHPPSQSIVVQSSGVPTAGAGNESSQSFSTFFQKNVQTQAGGFPFSHQHPNGGVYPSKAVEAKVSATFQPPQEATNNLFGIADDAWKKLGKEISLKAALLSIPEEVVSLYKSTPIADKRKLNEMLRGKTTLLFLTIDHKEVIIKGTVLGKNTFNIMEDYIDKNLKKNKITKEDADLRKRAVDLFRSLTQNQRKALIRLLEMDLTTIGAAKTAA